MLALGAARKVIIHLNEDTGSRGDYLYREVIDFLLARGVQGATVIRAAAGFGPQHHLHASGAGGATGQHLPLRIEFIESIAKMDALLPPLLELVSDGLIEAQDTTVLKTAAQERRY
jgi:PII-like signaling protein